MVSSSFGYMRIAKWVLLYNSGVISRTVFLHLARRAIDKWWEYARTKEMDARLMEQIHKEIEDTEKRKLPILPRIGDHRRRS